MQGKELLSPHPGAGPLGTGPAGHSSTPVLIIAGHPSMPGPAPGLPPEGPDTQVLVWEHRPSRTRLIWSCMGASARMGMGTTGSKEQQHGAPANQGKGTAEGKSGAECKRLLASSTLSIPAQACSLQPYQHRDASCWVKSTPRIPASPRGEREADRCSATRCCPCESSTRAQTHVLLQPPRMPTGKKGASERATTNGEPHFICRLFNRASQQCGGSAPCSAADGKGRGAKTQPTSLPLSRLPQDPRSPRSGTEYHAKIKPGARGGAPSLVSNKS